MSDQYHQVLFKINFLRIERNKYTKLKRKINNMRVKVNIIIMKILK